MPTEQQYLQRIEALEARVAELTRQLEVVTRERDEARSLLGAPGVVAGSPGEEEASAASRGSSCRFCDGEGVYRVHDFEMVCRRCNGTGRSPATPGGAESGRTSI